MSTYDQPDYVEVRGTEFEPVIEVQPVIEVLPVYETPPAASGSQEQAMLYFGAGLAGALALTYGAKLIRARTRKSIAQSMTVVVSRDRVDAFLMSEDNLVRAAGSQKDLRLFERLELRDAPGGRGTEIYASSRFARNKYEIKNALRRAKALLETGEMPTGARYQ